MVSTNGEVKKKKNNLEKQSSRRENCAQHCERQMEGNRSNTGEDEGQHGDSLVQKRQQ